MSNLASPKTGCTSASSSKVGYAEAPPSFTENRLHLGQKQCKSKAETKLVLAMLRRSLRSLRSSNSTLLRSRSQRLASYSL